ncbi:hypothetical protein D9M71_553110 [compost metagenome]
MPSSRAMLLTWAIEALIDRKVCGLTTLPAPRAMVPVAASSGTFWLASMTAMLGFSLASIMRSAKSSWPTPLSTTTSRLPMRLMSSERGS